MTKHIDYTDKKIGRLTFIRDYKKGKRRFWVCLCDCGKEIEYRADYISVMKCIGREFECTTCKEERRWPDLTGREYGRLTVIRKVKSLDNHHTFYLCKCECGVEKEIKGVSLTHKTKPTKSCGCYMRKLHSKWVNTTRYPPAHGHKKNKNVKTIKAKIYFSRNVFVAKCYNKDHPNYDKYGGTGVTVCDLWRNSVKDFYNWALENGYEEGFGIFLKKGANQFNPKNCYWMDKGKFHSHNNSKFVEYNGETKSITGWAKSFGCSPESLYERIKRHGIDEAINPDWSPKKNQKYGTEHYESEIISLYQKGNTYREISDKLGCSLSTINRFLKKNNILKRKAQCRSSLIFEERKDEIMKLYSEGKPWKEISKKTALKESSLRYHYSKWKNNELASKQKELAL